MFSEALNIARSLIVLAWDGRVRDIADSKIKCHHAAIRVDLNPIPFPELSIFEPSLIVEPVIFLGCPKNAFNGLRLSMYSYNLYIMRDA